MKLFFALLKREILEHKSILRVPMVLVGIAVLVKLSLSVGNLAIDINVPDQLELDGVINSALDGVVAKALNIMNYVIVLVMCLVSAFYALACLFNERQDQSVLFWRSLPISDSATVMSKLAIALLLIPLLIVLCQAIVAVFFFGANSLDYLSIYYTQSLPILAKMVLWSLLPVVSWCVFCSQIANKNPFLLAFIAPIIVIVVDKLFLNGVLSETLVINRVRMGSYTNMSLIWGSVFSAVCIVLAILKRSQRI